MANSRLLQTPLFGWHRAHGGRMVEFGGWLMPVQYSTIIDEHRAVRERVGLFDISHMGRLCFEGPGALSWVERVTTNHVAKLAGRQIQYSLMANETGGLIDDILVYRVPAGIMVVCNASNRESVVKALLNSRQGDEAQFRDETEWTAMLAIQGPSSLPTLRPLLDRPLEALPYYHSAEVPLLGGVPALVSRTGYTGEDGFEIIVTADQAQRIWTSLLEAGAAYGVLPCGLGARDTLRFEAGMPLYGHELSAKTNPYAAGLGWAVKLDKGDFIGREALRKWKVAPGQKRVGLQLEGKRIARQGATVLDGGRPIGVVTSGTYCPTLGQSLAMAYIDLGRDAPGTSLLVDVRGHGEPARVVPLPFYRRRAD